MKKTIHLFLMALVCSALPALAENKVYKAAELGLVPNTGKSMSAQMQKVIATIRTEMKKGDKAVLVLEKGRYDFHPQDAASRNYYVSNHDQPQPRPVGVPLEDLHDFVLDGQGADLVFSTLGYGHGVGLSQYGARYLALDGQTYDQILSHYYPGTQLRLEG